MRHPASSLCLLALVGLPACESTPEKIPVAGPDRLESGIWSVDFEPHRGLVMRRRDDPRPVATIRHVRLVLGAGRTTHHLPLRRAQRRGETLVLTCAPHPDHQLLVTIRPDGGDALRVEVRDEVALRSLVHEVTVEYEVPSDWPPNEAWLPHHHQAPDQVAGDGSFRVGIAYLRHGARALAWLPDRELLARHRRLPQALELDSNATGEGHMVRLRHGLVSHTVAADPTGGFRRGGAATPIAAAGEPLHFAHRLRMLEPADHRTLDRVFREVWDGATPTSGPPTGISFAAAAQQFFRRATTDDWIDLSHRRRRAGTFRTGRPELTGGGMPDRGTVDDAWFDAEQQSLRTALGLALFAERTGDRELPDKVRQVVAHALTAKTRSGLRPAIFCADPATRERRWVLHAKGAYAAGHYHALDAASSYYWMLRLRDRCPEQSAAVLAECRRFARFMRLNQHPSGAFPSYFEPRNLAPRKGPLYEHSAETGAIARFLFEYAVATSDVDALAAGRRAVGWIARQLEGGTWIDFETAQATGPSLDQRSGIRRDGTLGLIHCALAVLRLHELEPEPESLAIAQRLLAHLARQQQVWRPPWIPGAAIGGLGAGNFDHRWNDARQSLAALAFFEGYRRSDDPHWLERGIAALRAGLACGDVDYQPARDAAGPPATPHWGTGTACTVAELVRRSLGQGVVDLKRMRADGIDAVWFESLELGEADEAVQFRVWTHAAELGPIQVRFRNVPSNYESLRVRANGELLGVFSAEQLVAGITVTPTFVPLFDYRPPHEVSRQVSWTPRARVLRHTAAPQAHLEIRIDDRQVETVPLAFDPAQGLLSASDPFTLHQDLPVGSQIRSQLRYEVAGRTFTIPPVGELISTVSEVDRIDPGEGDELELIDSHQSRIKRFPDGLQTGRHLEGGGRATYEVPISREATRLALTVRVSGRVRIRTGEVVLHEDKVAVADARDLSFKLADHRLWQDGSLPLTVETADDATTADLAWIRHSASGRTTNTTGLGTTRRRRDPKRELRILVQPVKLLDRPLNVDLESLRLAFFGGDDYKLTPPPKSRRTAGSARQYLESLSGGRTSVGGEVLDPVEWGQLVADWDRPTTQFDESFARRCASDNPDIVVIVLGRGAVPAPRSVRAGARSIPVVFVPGRSDDDDFLACGRIANAVLQACFGARRLDTPAMGNFGDLALSGRRDNHLPPGPCGLNLVRTGWADHLVLERKSVANLPISPLLPGRQGYVFDCSDLPGRGRLVLETRTDGAGRPGLDGTSALLYWEFGPARALLRDVGGRTCMPSILRVSAQHGRLATPHVRGTGADLFRNAETQLPTVTLTGERIWEIVNYRPGRQGRASLDLRYLPTDLLRSPTAVWRVAGAPGGGVTHRLGRRVRLDLVAGETRVLQAPTTSELTRMFCRVLRVRGTLELIAGAGDQRATATLTPQRRPQWVEVDLPAGGRPFLAIANRSTSRATLDLGNLLVVPRVAAAHQIRPPQLEVVSSLHLMDGVLYGRARHLPAAPKGRSITVPVVLPAGPIALRIRAGLRRSAATPVQLTLALRDKTGERREVLLADQPIGATSRDAGLFLGIFEIPSRTASRVEFLEVHWKGPTDLYVVDLGIVRP